MPRIKFLTEDARIARKRAMDKIWNENNKERLKVYHAQYRKDHAEQRRSGNAAWRDKNLEKLRASHRDYWRIYSLENKEKIKLSRSKRKEQQRIYDAERRASNPDKQKAYASAYYENNRDKVKSTKDAWRSANLHKWAAICQGSRARKLQAIPAWADLSAIKDVYIEARYQQLHVDHIIPLKSNIVCGLHVWDNLQLLSQRENSLKGNKFDPEDYCHDY